MYYKVINGVVTEKSATFIDNAINIQNDIDLNKAVYLNGIIYDSTTLEYAKLVKTNELSNKIVEMVSNGYMTTLGIKAGCTQEDINAFAAFKIHVDNTHEASVDIYDYDGVKHTLTQENYLTFCNELGNYFSTIIYKRNDTLALIMSAESVEEVQAIVV